MGDRYLRQSLTVIVGVYVGGSVAIHHKGYAEGVFLVAADIAYGLVYIR